MTQDFSGRTVPHPDAGEGGGDLLLETLDQFAVGGDQTLLGHLIGNYELGSGLPLVDFWIAPMIRQSSSASSWMLLN